MIIISFKIKKLVKYTKNEPKLLHMFPPALWTFFWPWPNADICCDILPLFNPRLYCSGLLFPWLLTRLFIISCDAGLGAKFEFCAEADEASCIMKFCIDEEFKIGALLAPDWLKFKELFARSCCCNCCKCCCWNGELLDRWSTGKSDGSNGENDSTI